jgi:8-oxo-dGTP diphosphatase
MACVKTTVGAICRQEDKILLALRNHEPFYNHWCLPGGHIDFGESPEQAMKREVAEETGLLVVSYQFFNYYNEFYEDMAWHAVALIFAAEVSGKLKPQEAEVRQLSWFSPADALDLPLAFGHKKVLEEFGP